MGFAEAFINEMIGEASDLVRAAFARHRALAKRLLIKGSDAGVEKGLTHADKEKARKPRNRSWAII